MLVLLLVLGYLGLHLLSYKFLLPICPRLRSEVGIFAFHAASFAAAGLAVGIGGPIIRPALGWEWLVFVVAAHGIYSLSFLETWSLSQGSYSLALLGQVDRLGPAATRENLRELARVGEHKQAARELDLKNLGLLQISPGQPPTLTPRGRLLARIFWLLLRFTNGKPLNT